MEGRRLLYPTGCVRTVFTIFAFAIFMVMFWTIPRPGFTGVVHENNILGHKKHEPVPRIDADSIPEISKIGHFPERITDKTRTNLNQMINWENDSAFDDITCRSDRRITSCIYSKVKLLHINSTTHTIDVGITLHDGYNNIKKNGGDVILLWAERLPSRDRAPGHVIDHMNGTYSGSVRLHWSGQTRIYVKLASTKENVCLRFKAMKKYGDSVYAVKTPYDIYFRFVNLSTTEYTRCAPLNFVYGYNTLCNFTSLNGGFSWFCGKPTKPGLDCSSFDGFEMKPYNKSELVPNQPTDEVIHENGHCVFRDFLNIVIDPGQSELSTDVSMSVPSCSERPTKDSWLERRPSGYVLNQTWIFDNCQSAVNYESNSLNTCLSGKNIYFIGDSTLRQYLETMSNVMKIKPLSSDGFSKSAHSLKYNIQFSWRKHEMPFHNQELFGQQGVQSSTFQLSKLANDTSISGYNTIVVVHYGSHLQAFPPYVYRSRLQALTKALKELLIKKPGIKIFVRGAAPVIDDLKWFDVKIAIIFTDILNEEFADLRDHVIYLDVFSIFVANNMELLHPTGQTMHNQIQQLLAYLC